MAQKFYIAQKYFIFNMHFIATDKQHTRENVSGHKNNTYIFLPVKIIFVIN